MTLRLTSATVTFSINTSSPMIFNRLTICETRRSESGLLMSTPPPSPEAAAVCEYWPVVASPPLTKICARSTAH